MKRAGCLIALLSADSAALGVWDEDGALARHKVLTGYTVRAKQGKSQLYYSQQGGGKPPQESAMLGGAKKAAHGVFFVKPKGETRT